MLVKKDFLTWLAGGSADSQSDVRLEIRFENFLMTQAAGFDSPWIDQIQKLVIHCFKDCICEQILFNFINVDPIV